MPLADGCNHIALVTSDLDRLIDFYTAVFDAEVPFTLDEDGLRHAMIHLGGGFHLHAFEMDGSDHGTGSQEAFARGHLDHVAVWISDPRHFHQVRSRLVEHGTTDGTLIDFGPIRTVWFTDPDGMGCEIATASTGAPRLFEERGVEGYVA